MHHVLPVLRQYKIFYVALFVGLLLHLLLFSNNGVQYLPLFLVMYGGVGWILFSIRDRKLRFPDVKLVLLLFGIGLIGKFASRLGYAVAYLEVPSVYELRNLAEVSGGGWYTWLAVLFYPACVLLFYCGLKYKIHPVFYVIALLFLAFDVLVVAMRMTPAFVALFGFLFLGALFPLRRLLVALLPIMLVLVVVFYHTTEMKLQSQDAINWENFLKATVSTDVAEIDQTILNKIDNGYVYSTVFLANYLFHPVAEFQHYLSSESVNWHTLRLLKLKGEFCVVTGCEVANEISRIDDRYGVYKTLFHSLIFDFGILWASAILLVVGIACYGLFRLQMYGFVQMFILMIVLLSPIENFIMVGMGLVQEMVMLTMVALSGFVSCSVRCEDGNVSAAIGGA